MNTTLSDGTVDVQRLSYWHVGVFQESISILFNDCAQHRDISCIGGGVVSVGAMSSNQVGRTDWTPIALAELVFLMLSLRRR